MKLSGGRSRIHHPIDSKRIAREEKRRKEDGERAKRQRIPFRGRFAIKPEFRWPYAHTCVYYAHVRAYFMHLYITLVRVDGAGSGAVRFARSISRTLLWLTSAEFTAFDGARRLESARLSNDHVERYPDARA